METTFTIRHTDVLSKKNFEYFYEAYKVSLQSNCEFRYGVSLVYRNKIIATGCNNYRKGLGRGRRTMHAEIYALNNLRHDRKISPDEKRRFNNIDMYIVKRNSNQAKELNECKSCHDCQIKIDKLKKVGYIKNVFYCTMSPCVKD